MKNNRWSTREDKINFLRNHPDLWDAHEKVIKQALVEAKLVSPKTYIRDIGLWRICEDLKNEAKRKKREEAQRKPQ